MTDQARTFWNGRRQADAMVLNQLIGQRFSETRGATLSVADQPALEAFREFANSYYHLFNNGGHDWNKRGQGIIKAARKYGVSEYMTIGTIRTRIQYDDHFYDRLEELGDKVIDAALAEAKIVKVEFA